MATLRAAIAQAEADLSRTKQDADRAEQMFKEKLGAKQDFDSKKSMYEAQKGRSRPSQGPSGAGTVAARADRRAAYFRPSGASPSPKPRWRAAADILRKYDSYAPLDGVVTNLPVRAGESVVPGLQNQTGTNIMTIADMSLITAEVKVDETDIVKRQAQPGGGNYHRRYPQQDL